MALVRGIELWENLKAHYGKSITRMALLQNKWFLVGCGQHYISIDHLQCFGTLLDPKLI